MLTGCKASEPQTSSLSATEAGRRGMPSPSRGCPLDSGHIPLAYQAQGVPCSFRLRAHSTRSVASSWALARGASLTDICRAAGCATPNTFARFCSLRVESVFSSQMGRSTEGLRFQAGLLKTAPESPYCRPCQTPPSPRQPDVAENACVNSTV